MKLSMDDFNIKSKYYIDDYKLKYGCDKFGSDGRIIDKIEREDRSLWERPDDDPYKQYDLICAEYNKRKFELQKKSSLAMMGGIVKSTIERPIIGTLALDTCYGIMFYDRKNNFGLVGHGAPSSKEATLYEMFNIIDDGTVRVVEYFIVPGFRNVDYHNMKGLEELILDIKRYKSEKVTFVPFRGDTDIKLHQNTLSYEFAFDTSTGEFVTQELFYEEIDNNPRFISKGRRY